MRSVHQSLAQHSVCIVSISSFIMLPLAVCQSLVLSTAAYISLLLLLSISVIVANLAVNLAAPLANPPEGETSTSGAQLEKHCVASLECVSMDDIAVYWVYGFMGLYSIEGIWKRFSITSLPQGRDHCGGRGEMWSRILAFSMTFYRIHINRFASLVNKQSPIQLIQHVNTVPHHMR